MRGKIVRFLLLALVLALPFVIGGLNDGRLLTKAFLGFLAAVICIQLLPVVMLFGAMIKGVLAGRDTEETIASGERNRHD